MELFLVAVAQVLDEASSSSSQLTFLGETKVFGLPVNGVNALSGFKLHLSAQMRSRVRA